jgi:multidrug efflux pump subunit AcrB
VPPPRMDSVEELKQTLVRGSNGHDEPAGQPVLATNDPPAVLLRDIAEITTTVTPAEVDRYNMRRYVSVSANVATADLGRVRRQVLAAVREATAELIDEKFLADVAKLKAEKKWTPEDEEKLESQRQADQKAQKVPGGVLIDVRGQLATLADVQRNLAVGLAVAVVAILLLLTAYYQSILLALVSLSGVPLTLCGVALALLLTGTTLNLQSFMGAIMAVGVSVANAILLVTFAERSRVATRSATRGALDGGVSRLRPILMTSCAMIAGMLPMALGFGSGGDQTSPLGRAVVGGLVLSTVATLFVLPAVFALAMGRATVVDASLDPDDPNSPRYDADMVKLFPDHA